MSRIKTIYLVDDDDDWRFLIKEAIQEVGISVEVLEADTGQALFEILQEDTSDAFLILDVNMPVMNGLETLKILRKSPDWSAMPVFLVSSSSDKSLSLLAQNLGATTFIPKPAHFDEYVALVQKIYACT